MKHSFNVEKAKRRAKYSGPVKVVMIEVDDPYSFVKVQGEKGKYGVGFANCDQFNPERGPEVAFFRAVRKLAAVNG